MSPSDCSAHSLSGRAILNAILVFKSMERGKRQSGKADDDISREANVMSMKLIMLLKLRQCPSQVQVSLVLTF